MLRYIVLFVWIAVSVQGDTLSEDEKKEFMLFIQPVAEKCMEEYKLTKDDLMKNKETKNIEGVDPCFFACTLKGHQIIDDEGMYTPHEAYSIIDKLVQNEEVRNKIKEVGDICLAVNDKDVGDGNKGCERALLLVKCFMENKME